MEISTHIYTYNILNYRNPAVQDILMIWLTIAQYLLEKFSYYMYTKDDLYLGKGIDLFFSNKRLWGW